MNVFLELKYLCSEEREDLVFKSEEVTLLMFLTKLRLVIEVKGFRVDI